MTRESIAERIIEIGILPVVRAASGAEAIAVADALGEGGIRALEITMTVPGAVKVIADAVARYGDQMLIGAGTVLDEEQARACIDAGARFIVAPIVDVPTIAVCRRADVAVLPGALSPTEVVQAWRAGRGLREGVSVQRGRRRRLHQGAQGAAAADPAGADRRRDARHRRRLLCRRRQRRRRRRRPVRSAGHSQRTARHAGRGGARLRVRGRSGASGEILLMPFGPLDLSGRTAVVIGGTTGIGRALTPGARGTPAPTWCRRRAEPRSWTKRPRWSRPPAAEPCGS